MGGDDGADDGADDDGSVDGADDDKEDDTAGMGDDGADDGADDDGSVDGADDDKEDDIPAAAVLAQGIANDVNKIIDSIYGPPPTPAPTEKEAATADDIVNQLTDTAMDIADSISSAMNP